MVRLKEREDCYLRIAFKEVDGRTKRQIEEDRKKGMLENYVKKFGKVCIGIHGKELPKYSDMQTGDESKAWWKQKRGYTENPMYKSHKILSQDHKFWAKNDQIFVSDVLEDSAPADPFKTTHI